MSELLKLILSILGIVLVFIIWVLIIEGRKKIRNQHLENVINVVMEHLFLKIILKRKNVEDVMITKDNSRGTKK